MSFITITLILFLIMDPIGNTSSYLSLVRGIERKREKKILFREMFIALFAMIVFNYIGEGIFYALNISETTVKIASGLILFIIALQILFPTLSSVRQTLPKGEPFVIPLAIPLIAGPSLLATIMLFARMTTSQTLMLGAIITAWFFACLILFFSHRIQRFMGENGLTALEKLMGMVLVLLAIQRFMDGLRQFLENAS